MADGVFNVAKGRVNELVRRVDTNDPANSALVVVVLQSSGLVSDATLIDYATLDALLAGASNEATNTGYARKVLTDADLSAPTPDNTNDRQEADIPDQTWTGVQATGGAWAKLIVCYDPDTTGGTDADIIPLTHHDFAVTPDGSSIQATINAAGFFRAS